MSDVNILIAKFKSFSIGNVDIHTGDNNMNCDDTPENDGYDADCEVEIEFSYGDEMNTEQI